MRKIIVFAVLFFTAHLALAQGEFEFKDVDHDFGEVTEGDKAIHVFTFTNVGDAPIHLSNVKASCGCTTPEWPKEPILPGETSQIKAIYNSKNRPGNFFKTITITSNASEPTFQLKIKGKVISAAGAGE